MEVIRYDNGYHDLLTHLEKTNESLYFYKSNKEICKKDLHKLELENSALSEENKYLKKKIKNIEQKLELTQDKSPGPDILKSPYKKELAKKGEFNPPQKSKTLDFLPLSISSHKKVSNCARVSWTSNMSKRYLTTFEKAFIHTSLLFRL